MTKVATAILSTTAKAKAKAKKDAEAKKEAEGVAKAAEAMETGEEKKEEKEAVKVEEALSETLKNPARVAPSQEKHIVFQVRPPPFFFRLIASLAVPPCTWNDRKLGTCPFV